MAKSTSTAALTAAARRPAVLEWTLSPLVLLGLAVAGTMLILFVYGFRLEPSVLFLTLGWLSIVGAAALMWKVGLLVAAGDVGDDGSFDTVSTRADELGAEKASLLKAIKEIEFDRMMGKLSEDDAAEITEIYRRRAIRILRELDRVDPDSDGKMSPRDLIERDLRARARLARADKGTAARVQARKSKVSAVALAADDGETGEQNTTEEEE